ncbi:hypothetical protein O181_050970 [Austropuccinia psidii MF-1]|uniref:Uncharacterized protein n=1 Tax=Austropuccinia psidii MF-1 TaxID=1389203 RepID=A0A9Q3HRD1_9BASI|nr:hypothetical protein [Austropuccinia psidii MF-1]
MHNPSGPKPHNTCPPGVEHTNKIHHGDLFGPKRPSAQTQLNLSLHPNIQHSPLATHSHSYQHTLLINPRSDTQKQSYSYFETKPTWKAETHTVA